MASPIVDAPANPMVIEYEPEVEKVEEVEEEEAIVGERNEQADNLG